LDRLTRMGNATRPGPQVRSSFSQWHRIIQVYRVTHFHPTCRSIKR
jgi:hypothetical protein